MPPKENPHRLIEDMRKEAGPLPDTQERGEHIQQKKEAMEDRVEKKETTTFEDILSYDMLRQHHRLQFLESKRQLGEQVDPVDEQLASLHLTYLEYLPRVLNQYLEIWDHQIALSHDPLLPPLSPSIRSRENALTAQLRSIRSIRQAYNAIGRAIIARIRFDSVSRMEVPQEQYEGKFARGRDLLTILQQLKEVPDVSQSAREAVNETDSERAKSLLRSALTELENQLLAIFEGKNEEGKTTDTPLALYVDTLTATYRALAERERYVAASGMSYASKIRVLFQLRMDRERMAQEIVQATAALGTYQIDMTELTAVKKMFGRDQYITNQRFAEYEPIPLSEAEKQKRMEAALRFADDRTAGRIAGFNRYFNAIGGEALHIGLWEHLEDRWNKNGRETSRWVIEKVLDLVTLLPSAVREFIGVSGRTKEEIMQPLYEAMGYPPGETDFNKLTTEQQQRVHNRAISIRDLILKFDRTKIDTVRSTIRVLQLLPKAEQYVGQNVQREKLAALRQQYPVVTEENLPLLIRDSNAATAYHLVFLQLRDQFGIWEPPSGYIAELKKLMDGIQKNMSTHMDFSVAFREVGRNLWPQDWWRVLATAGGAGMGWGAGKLAGPLFPRGGRIMTGVVAAQSASKLVDDWREIQKLNEGKAETLAQIQAIQDDMRKQLDNAPAHFEKVREDEYRHRESGITITLRNEEQINALMNSMLTGEYVRTGKDAGMLALWLRYALKAKTVVSRSGIILLAVDIGADTWLDARRRNLILTFVRDASPLLLSAFGIHTQLGLQLYTQREGEFDMLDVASKTGGSFNEREREEIRKKLLFSIFQQQCGMIGREALWEITGEWQTNASLELFYHNEFQTVVYPAYLTLLARDTDIPPEILLAGKTRSDNLFPDRVSIAQIRSAMHEALILYVQHVSEREYLAAVKTLEELRSRQTRDPENPSLRQQVADAFYVVSVLGQTKCLGQPLTAITSGDAETNQWKTRTELMITTLQGRLREGDRRYLITSTESAIRGLPAKSIDLRSSDAVYRLVEDPALRAKIDVSRIPRTNAERSEWSSFGSTLYTENSWRELLPQYHGQQEQKTLTHAEILEAVNQLRRKLRKPEIEPAPSSVGEVASAILDAGSSEAQGQKISPEYAQVLFTEEAAQVVEIGRAQSRFSRGIWQENHLFQSSPYPFVLLAGRLNDDLCKQLSAPNLRGSTFARKNLRAVVFEEVPGFHGNCVLATYVYGSLTERKVTIVQNVAREMAHAHSKVGYMSLPRPISVPDLSRMPGLLSLLGRTRAMEQEEQVKMRQRKAEYEHQQPERERKRQEREELEFRAREEAIARARQSTSPVLVPEAGSGQEYIPAEYWQRHGDKLVSYAMPSHEPSIGPPSAGPREGLHTPDADDAITFTIHELDGMIIKTWTVQNMDYQTQQNLTVEDRALITDIITTPIPNSDRVSLERIIHLFPWELSVPGKLSSFFRKTRNDRVELVSALLPLFQAAHAEKKQEFLKELQRRLTEKGMVNATTSSTLIAWFKEHRNRFEGKE